MVYKAPGVVVNGTQNITGSTQFVNPSTVAIIGNVTAYPQRSQTVVLSDGSTATVQGVNIVSGSITASTVNGTQLVQGTDYTLSTGSDGQSFTLTIINESFGTQAVLITYQSIPADFFQALAWWSLANVEAYYGQAFDETGNVSSPLSAAASLAFSNGATSVCIIPVYDPSGDAANATTGVSTNTSGVTTGQTWGAALQALRLRNDISLIVPVAASSDELTQVAAHVTWCCANQLERRAITGVDGTTTAYTETQLAAIAASLNSDEILFVPNTTVQLYGGSTVSQVSAPGWLAAAALAGLTLAQDFWESLTNKTVSGFAGIQQYSLEEMNTLAGSGCCVLTAQSGAVTVREAVTTLQSSKVDWSYSGVYNYLMEYARSLFQPYIGRPSNNAVVLSISARTEGWLADLVRQQIIYGYQNLQVSRQSNDPSTVMVSFDVSWENPLLYVQVGFDFNTSYGSTGSTSVTVSGGSNSGSSSTSSTASATSSSSTSSTSSSTGSES